MYDTALSRVETRIVLPNKSYVRYFTWFDGGRLGCTVFKVTDELGDDCKLKVEELISPRSSYFWHSVQVGTRHLYQLKDKSKNFRQLSEVVSSEIQLIERKSPNLNHGNYPTLSNYIDKCLILAGGRSKPNSVERYDLKTNTWQTL